MVGLIVLGLVVGVTMAEFGIEKPWTYVVIAVVTIIVVPPVVRYRLRNRS